jgi:hypothetical protein
MSSFTVVPIALTNSRNKAVMYRKGMDFVGSKQPVPTKIETPPQAANAMTIVEPMETAIVEPMETAIMEPLSFGACCGLGHRITYNLRTLVYAMRTKRHAYACWTDMKWIFVSTTLCTLRRGRYRRNIMAMAIQ